MYQTCITDILHMWKKCDRFTSVLIKVCPASYVHCLNTSNYLVLNIETGLYINTALENSLCEFCEKNVMEDETHFIC